jgi:hypothetical protein
MVYLYLTEAAVCYHVVFRAALVGHAATVRSAIVPRWSDHGHEDGRGEDSVGQRPRVAGRDSLPESRAKSVYTVSVFMVRFIWALRKGRLVPC